MALNKSLAEIDEMPCDEYDSWRAYFEVEPWGTQAAEILSAQVCQTLCAVNGSKNIPNMRDLMPFASIQRKMMAETPKPEDLQRKIELSGIRINKNV